MGLAVGSSLFLAGHAQNALTRARLVTVTSENALYPKANLQNGFPWKPFKFNAAGTNLEFKFDNAIFYYDFEADSTGAAPGGEWVTVAGSPTVETAPGAGHGTKSLRLNAAAESSRLDFEMPSGVAFDIGISLWGTGSEFIDAFLLNLETGRYFNGSSWGTSKTAFQSQSAAAWSDSVTQVSAEQPGWGWMGGLSRFRLILEKRSGTGAAYADQIAVWPDTDFASLHNYSNIPEAVSVLAQSSADDSAYSTIGTFTARHYRNYVYFPGATSRRYWKFLISGECYFAPKVGQPVLGQAFVFDQPVNRGQSMVRTMPMGGVASESLALPVALADAPRLQAHLSWLEHTNGLRRVADSLVAASRYGVEPVVIVPDADKPEIVYGRGGGLRSFSYQRTSPDLWEYGLQVEDDPYSYQST